MFTGIVEAVGTVTESSDTDGVRRLRIDAPMIASDLSIGDSVSVQGACLTVVRSDGSGFVVQLVSETLQRTALGTVGAGSRVNLERAMPAGGRFDGHIVQGHVDGVGVVSALEHREDGTRLSVRVPAAITRYVVEKGSITIDGVSLTVAAIDGDAVEVALIPHTLAVTTLGTLAVSSPVNLEADILAKYVERLMEARA